jgi:hypothetical protein
MGERRRWIHRRKLCLPSVRPFVWRETREKREKDWVRASINKSEACSCQSWMLRSRQKRVELARRPCLSPSPTTTEPSFSAYMSPARRAPGGDLPAGAAPKETLNDLAGCVPSWFDHSSLSWIEISSLCDSHNMTTRAWSYSAWQEGIAQDAI